MYNVISKARITLILCRRLYSNSLQPEDISKNKHIGEKQLPEWRKQWSQKENEWYSSFKMFAPEKNPNIDIIKFLQNISFTPSAIKKWWRKRKLTLKKLDQTFIKERHQILGSDLAAAHFIVHRGGAVRFYDSQEWIRKDQDDNYKLPSFYDANKIIEAIDCSDMDLFYEGLENIQRLQKIKWLSLKNCRYIDDFCIDRISAEFRNSLVHLDISGCPRVTERGLVALYKTTELKTLVVTNKKMSISFELTCCMLEELFPNLKIISQDT